MTGLSKEQRASIKKSYLSIVSLILTEERIESRYVRCLLRWGFELDLSPDDLRQANLTSENLKFTSPADKVEKVEAVYHLVHMICMDRVVEDVELEIASMYAVKLGFTPTMVSDLFKAIVTADSDGAPQGNVRQQVVDFLGLYDKS